MKYFLVLIVCGFCSLRADKINCNDFGCGKITVLEKYGNGNTKIQKRVFVYNDRGIKTYKVELTSYFTSGQEKMVTSCINTSKCKTLKAVEYYTSGQLKNSYESTEPRLGLNKVVKAMYKPNGDVGGVESASEMTNNYLFLAEEILLRHKGTLYRKKK